MNRYETSEWVELVEIQNSDRFVNQDILTITGFMDHTEFLAHLYRYKILAAGK